MEDLHKKWSHRWTNPKLKVYNSKIHGIGLVAINKIKKDEMVCIVGGIIVPVSDIENYWKRVGHFGTQVNDNFYIVPSTKKEIEIGGAFNHSCDPNVGWEGDIRAVAMREINEGEELTMDYAMYDSNIEKFKCSCGSKNCRGFIQAGDWQNKELQKKFGKYFSPYLKKKFM
ncbi:SET domain-containing protein-lysine N-methyltransferase [Candidatus Pacearchaeota archaeon]|nr:SET domain-containing protein-lysine N-methyltransferase [Candidatus Pacearchaeota archaeon]